MTASVTRACTVGSSKDEEFPMILEMKRIAPGHANTWFLEISGTKASARFSSKFPRTLETLHYERGKPQAWQVQDLGYESAYPAITGGIFEFGFADAIQQRGDVAALVISRDDDRDIRRGQSFLRRLLPLDQAHRRPLTLLARSTG